MIEEEAKAQLFNVVATRTSNGQAVSGNFNSAEDALNFFDGQNLNSAFGTNVDNEPVTVALNYRGLGASLAYDSGNNLVLNIDGIVSNQVFSGSSRDASLDLLKDYLKSDGADILDRINKRLAAVSPTDPIAGNPISLMSQMVGDDFELGFVDTIHDSSDIGDDGKKVGNEMGAGVQYSSYNVSGIKSDVISVSPFSYRNNLGESDFKLLLKVPVVKMITTENHAKTYQASAAIGLLIPLIKDIWSISPIVSIGAVGSEDLGSAAAIRGFSVTNKLGFTAENGFGLHLGTLLGNYKTERLEINNYRSDPNIENNVLKNSLVLTVPTGYTSYVLDFAATNVRFFGDDLYIENAMDYGIGLVKSSRANNNEMRLDLKYYTYDAERIASIGNGKKSVSGFSVNLKFQY